MKKFQLRNIIRESIKELMTEQSYPWAPNMGQGQFVLSQVNDAIAALQNMGPPSMIVGMETDFQGNITQPPTAIINFQYCVCVPEAAAAGIVSNNFMNNPSSTAQCVSTTITEDGSGIGINRLNGVGGMPQIPNHSLAQLATDPNSGFYDTMVGPNGANAGCSAFNLSQQVMGCTHPNACNYDPAATQNDGSCTYGPAGPLQPCPPTPVVIEGCMDPLASNYDATATQDDGSCVYPAGSGTSTPLDRGPQMATPDRTKNDPNVTQDNPQVRRMRELANIKNK